MGQHSEEIDKMKLVAKRVRDPVLRLKKLLDIAHFEVIDAAMSGDWMNWVKLKRRYNRDRQVYQAVSRLKKKIREFE